MANVARSDAFANEALNRLLARQSVGPDQFERHILLGKIVAGPVNNAHAALANKSANGVSPGKNIARLERLHLIVSRASGLAAIIIHCLEAAYSAQAGKVRLRLWLCGRDRQRRPAFAAETRVLGRLRLAFRTFHPAAFCEAGMRLIVISSIVPK